MSSQTIRSYRLRRITESNMKRSIAGAVARSRGGFVHVCLGLSGRRFPAKFEQCSFPDGVYVEGLTYGKFALGGMGLLLWDMQKECYRYAGLIYPSEIDSMEVSYKAKEN